MPEVAVRTSCDVRFCHVRFQRLQDLGEQGMKQLAPELAEFRITRILFGCCSIIVNNFKTLALGQTYFLVLQENQ
jgi:hypothetical protein